ncbi:MAG: NADH-quinone oxidoreductase subunit K [Desulfurococcales archaeon]|nr:NADH-quinone oxidoreductase subunit K [Desulfurococcales archaeon]MEB3765720.1 NADH-quinone oxidoreductase subunit K [Desulfurococcales archaeon]
MALVDVTIAGIALITSAFMAAIAAYGMTYSKSFIRQLLSIEILFNAVLLAIIVLSALSPASLTAFSIILISVVAGEVIVIVAVIAAYYRVAKALDSSALEEEGV